MAWAAYTPGYTILSDLQDLEVLPNSGFIQIRERAIRIETPQGIDHYGQAKIYYDGNRDQVEIIEAYTIRPNGEKVHVGKDRIKRSGANAEDVAPYFTDQMVAVIIFPQVEVGSQLYYKTKIETREPVIKGRFGSLTTYTPHRRYERAEIRVVHPASTNIQAYSRGVDGTRTILEDGRVQHVYRYQQDSAVPLEPGQVEYADFAPSVQFSNYENYADLARTTQLLFQPKTVVTPRIQKLADSLTEGAKNRERKPGDFTTGSARTFAMLVLMWVLAASSRILPTRYWRMVMAIAKTTR